MFYLRSNDMLFGWIPTLVFLLSKGSLTDRDIELLLSR
jgi:hypothetical protein